MYAVPCGYFPPASPMASDAGMQALAGKRDYGAVKTALEKAGYQGEKVVFMVGTDQPVLNALSPVAADMLKKVGVNVDYQATDWGMVVQRRSLTKPPAEGGWNLFITGFSGLDFFTPASHLPLRGNGKAAWFGWPDDPKMESLRESWFNAPDLAAQKKVAEDMQLQAFDNVPYWPLGSSLQPTAFRKDVTGVPEGFVIFWNVRRT
jgi:peptide/nickel transport system substrate-binding protein